MGNENMAGLRLAYVAASVTLATAGVYVATSGKQATAPPQEERLTEVSASIRADVERTMLTSRVISQGEVHDPFAAGIAAPAAPAQVEDRSPVPPSDEEADTGENAGGELASEPDVEPPREPAVPSTTTSRTRTVVTAPSVPHEDLGAHRNRMSEANVAARQIAIQESTAEAQRFLGVGSLGLPAEDTDSPSALPGESRQAAGDPAQDDAPTKLVSVDDSVDESADEGVAEEVAGPRSLGSDLMEKEDRHLLFVWDSSIVLDEARSEQLLTFAGHRGYDTLAVEATGVGYKDAALTEAFARFTAEATEAGIETFALIGYPWFTVAANAGLPGQPTSSAEGLAVLDVIAETELFDGVVDDSHPYGVVYEVDGESRNWLFDEPAAASLDLQAWLRSAKDAIGDLPLIKTTPFWYDSHPALQEMVNIEGEGFLTLGHLVATEVDAMAVLAYRDLIDGPNGLLELVAGEMSMGPSIITFETGDLGANLDYLTFHEEGLIPLEETTEDLVGHLLGEWAFAGVGVHHYEPLEDMATELADVQSFGFISLEAATVEFGALIDAYDSSLGTYTEQMTYNPVLDTMTGIGEGALISNGDIDLQGGALVHGDARAGQKSTVSTGYATIVTGEAISLSTPVDVPAIAPADSDGGQRASIGWNQSATLGGSATLSRLSMNSYSGLTITGPATVIIDDLQMGSNAFIWADSTNGPVTLLINERLSLGFKAFIAPTSIQARDLTIRYAGTRAIELGSSARILADIVAPSATISLGFESEIYGRATALALKVGSGANLHLDVDLLR